jgi:thioredoxin 1
MAVLELNAQTFQDIVARRSFVVIGFAAAESLPSGFEVLAQRHPEAAWGHVDPQRFAGVAAMFGITQGPALLIFRDQVVLYLEPRIPDVAELEELLVRVQRLDMNAVRAEIEEQKQAEAALRMRRICPTARRGPGMDPE